MKTLRADLAAACDVLRKASHAAVAIHENPDLDALGAAVGIIDLLHQLGTDHAHLYIDEDVRLPVANHVTPPGTVVRGRPPAVATLIALDSGSRERLALTLGTAAQVALNVDHHPDNTRFARVNLVWTWASSVAEIVCDIARALDLAPSPPAARALYTGISFDSGHFRHASTSAHTLASAAWLVELGADPAALYRELYERRSMAAMRLWARAVQGAVPVAGGKGVVAVLTAADYAAAGAGDDETEGIVEALRAVDGVDAVALVKEQLTGSRVRVSLRSRDLDVGALAAQRGGGGHRQAAGFACDDDPREVAAWLSSALGERLATASS